MLVNEIIEKISNEELIEKYRIPLMYQVIMVKLTTKHIEETLRSLPATVNKDEIMTALFGKEDE